MARVVRSAGRQLHGQLAAELGHAATPPRERVRLWEANLSASHAGGLILTKPGTNDRMAGVSCTHRTPSGPPVQAGTDRGVLVRSQSAQECVDGEPARENARLSRAVWDPQGHIRYI